MLGLLIARERFCVASSSPTSISSSSLNSGVSFRLPLPVAWLVVALSLLVRNRLLSLRWCSRGVEHSVSDASESERAPLLRECAGDDVPGGFLRLQRDWPDSRKPFANGLLSIFRRVMRSFCGYSRGGGGQKQRAKMSN